MQLPSTPLPPLDVRAPLPPSQERPHILPEPICAWMRELLTMHGITSDLLLATADRCERMSRLEASPPIAGSPKDWEAAAAILRLIAPIFARVPLFWSR